MGGLFDSGPSDGDIRRAEQRAQEDEAERLRLAEIRLRRRESRETIQGEGIATTGDILLGTDVAPTFTGLEAVEATRSAGPATVERERTEDEIIADLIARGEFGFSQTAIRPGGGVRANTGRPL